MSLLERKMSETTEDRVDVVGALREVRDFYASASRGWRRFTAQTPGRADHYAVVGRLAGELADDLETLREWFGYAAMMRPGIDKTREADAIARLARRLDVP